MLPQHPAGEMQLGVGVKGVDATGLGHGPDRACLHKGDINPHLVPQCASSSDLPCTLCGPGQAISRSVGLSGGKGGWFLIA
jgi:hypothetical protein